MSYPLNYPTQQNANVQIFYGGSGEDAKDWVKPQGASFVWFTLIGAGGGGDASTAGGGSGAVTNFMCPAFLIPDELSVQIGAGGKNGAAGGTTAIYYRSKAAYGPLLSASGGGGGAGAPNGASSMSANYFTAMGFFSINRRSKWYCWLNLCINNNFSFWRRRGRYFWELRLFIH